jgi:hypothetical protein
MRKMVLLASMMTLAALMLAAAPASAQELDEFCEEVDGFVICDFDEFCEDFDEDGFCDENNFFGNGVFDDGVEQEAESGDIDQTFDVSGPGDNSNQTVGIQGVANTGNAQNAFGFNDGFDDGFDDGFNDEFGDEFVFCDEDDDDRDGRIECEDIIIVFPDDDFFFEDDLFFDGNGDVEFEDVGASIELSPTQTVTSDQQVNQAAAASAFWPWWWVK